MITCFQLCFQYHLRRYSERIVTAFHDESVWVWTADTCQLMAKLAAPPVGSRGAAGLHGRGLHSSTFQLNLSRF